jgi:hypothetical protein
VVVGVPRGAIVGASGERNREPAGCATLGDRAIAADGAADVLVGAAVGAVLGVAGEGVGVRGAVSAIVFMGCSSSWTRPS